MKKLLFILLASVALVSCSKGPESTAKDFAENMAQGNIEEATKHVTSQTKSLLDMAMSFAGDESIPKYPDYKFEMVKDSIDGDNAWVTYITPEGNEDVLTLVKENDEWKVSIGK